MNMTPPPALPVLAWLFLAALALAPVLAACSSDGDEYDERQAQEIYDSALETLEDGDYVFATQEFNEVERQHPYSQLARQAILMSAYAQYRQNAYNEAILGAERYISLYPGSEDAAYAHYLIAVSYYEQISDVRRDQSRTEAALAALQELIRRYPDSEFAQDAALKIDLTYDHLAGKEMDVGRYYLRQDVYVAAINRFRNVVVRYQQTDHVPEALHRLMEAYLALGLAGEARAAAAVLGHNFPGNPWYEKSYDMLAEHGLVAGVAAPVAPAPEAPAPVEPPQVPAPPASRDAPGAPGAQSLLSPPPPLS